MSGEAEKEVVMVMEERNLHQAVLLNPLMRNLHLLKGSLKMQL